MAKWTEQDIPDLGGKTALVTGANSGLGLETARALAAKGAHVVLACRGVDKAQAAMDRIKTVAPDASLEFLALDLSDLESIRSAAAAFCDNHDRLDILCNNAGVMGIPQGKTRDGFEAVFGINHLGHFAFTGLLLDPIRATPGARIVTVSSLQAKNGELPMNDLNWLQRRYRKGAAYGQSKLANLSFALELNRRLAAHNINAMSLAAHPGYSATDITYARDAKPNVGRWIWTKLGQLGNLTLAQPAALGALPTLFAATAADVRGGEYYGPDGLAEFRGYPTIIVPGPLARDTDLAGRLWQASEKLTGTSWL